MYICIYVNNIGFVTARNQVGLYFDSSINASVVKTHTDGFFFDIPIARFFPFNNRIMFVLCIAVIIELLRWGSFFDIDLNVNGLSFT